MPLAGTCRPFKYLILSDCRAFFSARAFKSGSYLIAKSMRLQEAECELQRRLYRWAQFTMTREVAEDFPALRACQYNRRVKCFLQWMQDMSPEKRLPTCQTLVQRSYELHLAKSDRSADAEAVLMEYHAACSRYLDALPPTQDCDRHAPGFVIADAQSCMEAIIRELTPLCGKSRKLQKHKREFIQVFGDWTLSTHVQIWLKDQMVHGYSFLRRFDSESHHWGGEWSSRIDSLILLGISGSDFPFIGQTHEALCASSLRSSIAMFVPDIKKLIQGLGISQ